ncbi:MAG: pentapeptide repeat-containing protein [Deltaproteobacteria bacterium]|jgi:uncharacterized protein YjbI with pentapeptide repeats|nr:pentapeptide repeat-containing protein [Deltaproteobacteria bacterium]
MVNPTEINAPGLWQNRILYRYKGHDRLACSFFLGFSLRQPGHLLEPQKAMEAALEALGPYENLGLVLDMGVPKKEAEFLMAARAWAPDGKPVEALDVSMSVGSLRRDFLVLGFRESREPVPGPPLPFVAQPLSWETTFYEPDVNPYGISPNQTIIPQLGRAAGPMVYDAAFDRHGRTLSVPAMVGAPACPLPTPPLSARAKNRGTFDRAWLLTNSPGFPDDFDFDFFNLAQKSQRLKNNFFSGDEKISCLHLHPEFERLDSALPGLRLRFFIGRYSGIENNSYDFSQSLDAQTDESLFQELNWSETKPNLDTVWLFPERAAGLMIWHASLEVPDEMASTVANLVAVLEPLNDAPGLSVELIERAQTGNFLAFPFFEPDDDVDDDDDDDEPSDEQQVGREEAVISALAISSPALAVPTLAAAAPAAPDLSLPDPLDSLPTLPTEPAIVDPEAIIDEGRKLLAAELPELNAIMKANGLPEITMESMEPFMRETKAKMTMVAASMSEPGAAQVAKDPDSLVSGLMALGLSSGEAAGLEKAVKLEIPLRKMFETEDEYLAAVSNYRQNWAGALGISPSSADKHINSVMSADRFTMTGSATALAGLFIPGFDPNSSDAEEFAHKLLDYRPGPNEMLTSSLATLGFEPDQIEPMIDVLGKMETELSGPPQSLSSTQATLFSLGGQLESAMGLAPGQITSTLNTNMDLLKSVMYGSSDLGAQLGFWATTCPLLKQALPAIEKARLTNPAGFSSLVEIGQSCGLSDPEALMILKKIDPLNPYQSELPPLDSSDSELITDTVIPEALVPEFPGPSHVFVSRDEVLATLANHQFRQTEGFGAAFIGSSLVGLSIGGANFASLDLSGADFTDSDVTGCDFSGCNLNGAIFDGATVSKARFDEAVLTNTSWAGAYGEKLNFSGCNLAGANFTGAMVPGANFEASNLTGADLSEATLGRDFRKACLEQAIFGLGDLSGANFIGARCAGTCFTQMDLNAATFDRCDMTGVSMNECLLTKASFEGAKIERGRFDSCQLTQACFKDSFLDWAVFDNSKAGEADFTGCRATALEMSGLHLVRAVFRGGYLRGAGFSRANLAGADLSGADLFESSLGSADLRGANLAGASLYGADLYRVRIDDRTVFFGTDLGNTSLSLDGVAVVG